MTRKYTKARKDANKAWDDDNLDRMSIAVPKGMKDQIKDHAANRGESANKFIIRAINETMERDLLQATPGGIGAAGVGLGDPQE